MDPRHPKRLIVEGKAEIGAIPALMEANGVEWPDDPDKYPVRIHVKDGVRAILEPGTVTNHLAEEGVQTLGIVIDANDELGGRWRRLRGECVEAFPGLPKSFPMEGLIAQNADGKRLGMWIMPDNHSQGMLDTFLGLLVSSAQKAVWQYVEQAVAQAKECGAPYKDVHVDKAKIYTYLAWQHEPGMLFGTAVSSRCLDPQSEHAAAFVNWFKRLYELGG